MKRCCKYVECRSAEKTAALTVEVERLRVQVNALGNDADAARMRVTEQQHEIERLRAQVAVQRDGHQRLTTIVDEEFGMQPVMTADELLTLLEKKLFEQRVESERLRAENADLVRANEALAASNNVLVDQTSLVQDGDVREYIRIKAGHLGAVVAEQLRALKAENAELRARIVFNDCRHKCARVDNHVCDRCKELGWFRRLLPFLVKIGNPETSFVEAVRAQTDLQDWLEANPKPGLGEFAGACTADDTNVLSDSYAEFVRGS